MISRKKKKTLLHDEMVESPCIFSLVYEEKNPHQLTHDMDNDSEHPSDNASGTFGKLTEMLAQDLQAAHYRKLKLFSTNGTEESLEVWKEHTLKV